MDLELLTSYFDKLNWNIKSIQYKDVDFRNNNFKNNFILYCSSEDDGLHYKDYIEDILLGLEMQQAILIPKFYYFRAHHNKVFCEIIRDISDSKHMKNLKSNYYGTFEEYSAMTNFSIDEKVVLKVPDESCGNGVFLSENTIERDKTVLSISHTPQTKTERIKNFIKKHLNSKRHPFIFQSSNRKKFIIQEFISGLNSDWKILIYNNKYYALSRKIRKNDFRASGSNILDFSVKPPVELLNYSKSIYESFNVPYASLDICVKNNQYYLIEFQFISFGTATLEDSLWHFVCEDGEWHPIEGTSTLEEETAESIVAWISKNYETND